LPKKHIFHIPRRLCVAMVYLL